MMRSSCALRDWAVACPMGRIFSLTSRPSSWIRVADARPPLIRTGAPGAPRLYARTVGWQTKRDRTLGPFAHRAFAVYWAGGLLSNIGTWLQNGAGAVLVSAIVASGCYAWAFGINAATFVGPILAMAYLYRRDLGRGVSREMQRASAAVRSGIGAYVRAQPWVVSALLAVISTSAILEVVRTTAPVLVAQRLGAPSTEAGLVIAAQSTGSALGLLASIPLPRWDISRPIPVIGLAPQAAGLIAVSIATTLPIAAAGVAAIGCGFWLCFPIVTGVLQTEVPDAMRGRLMSFHQMAHLGNRPFTALAAGAIAATFGVPAACLAALALVPIGLFAVRATWRGLPVASPPEPVPAGSA